MTASIEQLQRHEIPGRVAIVAGHGGLPKVVVTTGVSTAEIYLHGAHVTAFQKQGEAPLLFLSGKSHFAADQPIRGGVPICFPWFGPREGQPAHGYARLADWDLVATTELSGDSVRVHLRLPEAVTRAHAFGGTVDFLVTVGDRLTMELQVTNTTSGPLSFEECLHTYFSIGDIGQVAVAGLQGKTYWDKVGGLSQKQETADAIRFGSEVDRVYPGATEAVEIRDAAGHRTIRVEKSGSASTVVWNPWVAKAKAMADFGDDEFQRMVCVESGNVGPDTISLAPAQSSSLKVVLSSRS